MTSRNLCFKLMREDLKRRVWVIAWSILSMVFSLVVPIALKCSEFAANQAVRDEAWRVRSIAQIVENGLSMNGGVIAVMVISAVLWAVSGFHYLHNRQKVDFYHSLPVKRHQLFLAVYFNGILVPLFCYVLAQAAGVGFALSAGIGYHQIGSLPWQSVLLHSVYYCLLYTTVIVAVMMTGHVVVALLGAGVFFGYGPALIGLYEWFCNSNFRTWIFESCPIDSYEQTCLRLLKYTSPASNYVYAATKFSSGDWQAWRALLVLCASAAFAALSYGLYRMRPSEAAGRAMAFPKTRTPIRLLISVPMGIAAGLFFGSMGNSVGWLVFGSVCGVLLTHCLMEIIYHFDFRKLFANRYQLVAASTVVLVLNLAGYYDLFGYDSWYPRADQIVDAALFEAHSENWVTYGDVEFVERSSSFGAGDESVYSWNYQDGSRYRLENMKLTDAYAVSELARLAAGQEKKKRFDETWKGPYRTVFMRVKMNNGREVYRRYNFASTSGEMDELFTSIADSREYKTGIYPLLSQAEEDTASVYFMQYGSGSDAPVNLDASGRARLLAAYRQDLLELSTETRRHEMPIGTIQFRTWAHDEAIAYNAQVRARLDYSIDLRNLTGRCVYPVYPSFARTLRILSEAGEEIRSFEDEDIVGIDIYYYGYENRKQDAETAGDLMQVFSEAAQPHPEFLKGGEVSYEDEEDIRALAPALLNQDYLDMNSYYDTYDTAPDGTVTRHLAKNVRVNVRIRRRGSYHSSGSEYDGEWTTGEYDGGWLAVETGGERMDGISCCIDLTKLSPETAAKYGLRP